MRQAQEALRQSEERYRRLLELSLDAIGYALDLDLTGFILREGLNFLQKPSKPEKIIQAVQYLLGE